MSVQRWKFADHSDPNANLTTEPDGEWVTHEDYVALCLLYENSQRRAGLAHIVETHLTGLNNDLVEQLHKMMRDEGDR